MLEGTSVQGAWQSLLCTCCVPVGPCLAARQGNFVNRKYHFDTNTRLNHSQGTSALKSVGCLEFSWCVQGHEHPHSKGNQTPSFTWEICWKSFGLNNRTHIEKQNKKCVANSTFNLTNVIIGLRMLSWFLWWLPSCFSCSTSHLPWRVYRGFSSLLLPKWWLDPPQGAVLL